MKHLTSTLFRVLLLTTAVLTFAPLVSAQDTQRNYRLDTGFNPVTDNGLRSIVVQPDGKVILAGYFDHTNGTASGTVARLNPDGSVDPNFHCDPIIGNALSVALQADGKLVVGGFFGNESGNTHRNIARLNADGSLDASFTASTDGLDYQVESVAVQADGKILLSGQFATVDGAEGSGGFARVNADGSLDTAFMAKRASTAAGVGLYFPVLQPDGKILAAGYIAQSGHQEVSRLNPDGSLDSAFSTSINADIYAIVPQADGKVIVGGKLNVSESANSPFVARLNADGSLDATFTSPAITDPASYPSVNAMAVQPDGKIVVGGQFSQVNGVAASNLARLRADGTLDPSFIANLNAPEASGNAVEAVVLQLDGKILAGGRFIAVNDAPHANVARLNADPTITIEALNGNISDADLAQGSFRLNRTGDALGSLTVNFLIRGGALNGTDYTIKNVLAGARDGKKKLKAGKLSKPIHVTPVNTGDGGGGLKGVKIKLAPGDGYIIGDPAVAKFKIVDQ